MNLAATEVRRVHIRVREILAHGVQGRVKAARCNARSGRPVTFAAVIVPVIVPSVVAGHAG